MLGYVYILQSLTNNRFYIGSTNDLNRRLKEHNAGKSTYTSFTVPFRLVFSQSFENLPLARKVEYWLKSQKDKDFIKRIIIEGKIVKVIS